MGHAIYTLSDPRAVILKKFAKKMAATKGMLMSLSSTRRWSGSLPRCSSR